MDHATDAVPRAMRVEAGRRIRGLILRGDVAMIRDWIDAGRPADLVGVAPSDDVDTWGGYAPWVRCQATMLIGTCVAHGLTRTMRMELLSSLLLAGARPDLPVGFGPMSFAADHGRHAMRLLLDHGAPFVDRDRPDDIRALRGKLTPDMIDAFGPPPIGMVAPDGGGWLHGDVDPVVAGRLVAAGADPMARDNAGWTPLHRAGTACAGVLIARGADVAARNTMGRTPLHTCVDPDVALVLLRHGADPTVRDTDGSLPAAVALDRGSHPGRPDHAGRLAVLLDAGTPWFPEPATDDGSGWTRQANGSWRATDDRTTGVHRAVAAAARGSRRAAILAMSWLAARGMPVDPAVVADAGERDWVCSGLTADDGAMRILAWLGST